MEIKDVKYIVLIPELIDFDRLFKVDPPRYGTGYYGLKSYGNFTALESFQIDRGENILEHFTLYETKDSALAAIEKALAFAKWRNKINGFSIETYIEYLNRLNVFEVEVSYKIKGFRNGKENEE